MYYRYLRDEDRNPYATVAVTESGAVGMALCHKNDTFKKTIGRHIASRRAEIMEAEIAELKEKANLENTAVIEALELVKSAYRGPALTASAQRKQLRDAVSALRERLPEQPDVLQD